MKSTLAVTPDHLKIVQKILLKYLSPKANVWAFGSRADGTAKKHSDLDLVIDDEGKPLTINTLADIKEDFTESDLPYKVDIVDWNTITPEFQESIRDQRVKITI